MNKDLGQFFTSNPVLKDYIYKLCKNKNKSNVKFLEPSAGGGDLLDLFEQDITAVEIDKHINNRSNKAIIKDNFFNYNLENKFDTIFGNPPYLKYNKEWNINTCYPSCNMYVYFIEKCFKHLKPNGEIIFVVPREFLNNTRIGRFREYLLKNGTFTDIIDFQENKMFEDSHPHIIIFRYQKDNFSHKTNYIFYNKDTTTTSYLCKNLLYNQIYYFFQNTPKHVLSDYFSIKVGLVSGANNIFEYNGIIDEDTIEIICSDYYKSNNKKKYYLTQNSEHPVLKNYKDTLINRGIRKFEEYNWYEWGAPRNIFFMEKLKDKPCLYVNCKTRNKNPFFKGKVDYFDGSILCLFPKENLDLDYYLNILNNSDTDFLYKIQGLIVGSRYSFSQKTLSNFRF